MSLLSCKVACQVKYLVLLPSCSCSRISPINDAFFPFFSLDENEARLDRRRPLPVIEGRLDWLLMDSLVALESAFDEDV